MKLKIVKEIYLYKKSGEKKSLAEIFKKNFSMTFNSQVVFKTSYKTLLQSNSQEAFFCKMGIRLMTKVVSQPKYLL